MHGFSQCVGSTLKVKHHGGHIIKGVVLMTSSSFYLHIQYIVWRADSINGKINRNMSIGKLVNNFSEPLAS